MNHNVKHRTQTMLFFCIALALAATASAQTWVASTGTVDPSSLSTYAFSGSAALVKGTNTGKVVLRYNILPTDEMLVNVTQPCCEGRALWVRFLDNGDAAQVLVNVKQLNVITGQTTTILSFNSNNYQPQSTFQDATPNTGLGPLVNFSFAEGPFNGSTNEGGNNVYYVEATLIRSAAGGTPGLQSVSIVRTLAP
jgi:hypothetical protein